MTDDPKTELFEIDKRAFEMATTVYGDPTQREALIQEADELSTRLLELNEELARRDSAQHEELKHTISESTLDLTFVCYGVQMYSMRLGRLHRRTKKS